MRYVKYLFRYNTPEGFDNLLMCADDETLTGLWFEGTQNKDCLIESFSETSLPPALNNTVRWLDIYFSGRQPDFTPKYRIDNLTAFRKLVLDIVLEIPFGHTMTYGDIAKRVARLPQEHRKMSAQAVGGAVGWNPICLIVPCHRVIGANGNLTGYGGGIHNKIALLEHEGHEMNQFSIPNEN